jgi:nucleoside-diphosphate-sugar epimerase
VIEAVLDREARGATFNVCADHHPTRRRIYPAEAERLGLDPPSFDGVEADGYKIVSNRKVRERLDYSFAYPDPMAPAP